MNEPVLRFNRESNDWSHVQETINMLIVAVCQIEATLSDSNTSVDTLTQSFIQLAKHTNEVSTQIQNIHEPDELNKFKQDLSDTAREMNANINSSIQAFQFYDRICQRLGHITGSLEQVSSVMSNTDKLESPQAWEKIQDDLKNSYTMDAEHIMFEFILRGGSVKEALEIYKHHFSANPEPNDDTNDEIELF